MTKIKNYTTVEKLKIIERVKNGKSKASLFCEHGVPEGTIRSWMKEENKLRSLVDSIEDGIGLQKKKTRLHGHSEVDKCLCKWFLQKHSERVLINGVILKAQAVKFSRLLGGDETFKVSDGWLWRWKV
jgi:transposase-like protein